MNQNVLKLSISLLRHFYKEFIMLKYLGLLTCSFFIISCQNNTIQNNSQLDSSKVDRVDLSNIDSVKTPVQSTLDKTGKAITDSIIEPESIIIPGYHRVWDENHVSKALNNEWWEIHKKSGGYAIQKANYTILDGGIDECSGMPEEIIEGKENVLYFFNIKGMQAGKVDSIAFKNKIVEPGKPFHFEFNGAKHTLEASGIHFFNDENRKIDNPYYSLKLYVDGKYVKTILHQTSYNDTSTEIEFIGDIDRDGKVDFILSSPRDYEENRILFILSTSPYAYQGTRQFDC